MEALILKLSSEYHVAHNEQALITARRSAGIHRPTTPGYNKLMYVLIIITIHITNIINIIYYHSTTIHNLFMYHSCTFKHHLNFFNYHSKDLILFFIHFSNFSHSFFFFFFFPLLSSLSSFYYFLSLLSRSTSNTPVQTPRSRLDERQVFVSTNPSLLVIDEVTKSPYQDQVVPSIFLLLPLLFLPRPIFILFILFHSFSFCSLFCCYSLQCF